MASVIAYIKNTLAENLGGPLPKLATDQFGLDDTPDQSGKVAVVTGGSEGNGYAITYTLIKHKISKVYMLSISEEKAENAVEAIAKDMGSEAGEKVAWLQCDLSDWKRVKEVAQNIEKSTDRLDMLINNAGRGIMTYQLTDYGVDRHMAANHIGHAILTSHLLPLMKKTANTGSIVRIVNMSSNLHESVPSNLKFKSVNDLNQDLGPKEQYGRSKLAGILYARYFNRKVTMAGHPNILMNATHPGIVSTKQSKHDIHEPLVFPHSSQDDLFGNAHVTRYPVAGYGMSVGFEPFKKTQFQGAVSTIFAATTTKESGQYICPPAVPEQGSSISQNEELADDLMELTRKVVETKTELKLAD
ncbi:hypothetical protein NHJ13734_004922 [Beauveria thailandica]